MTFTTQQIRDFVRARAHLLRAGWSPDDPLVVGLRRLRDRYRVRVGAATYLSQMLDECATASTARCVLGWEDGRVVDTFSEWEASKPIQRHLRQYTAGELPYVIEIDLGDGRVAVKYL